MTPSRACEIKLAVPSVRAALVARCVACAAWLRSRPFTCPVQYSTCALAPPPLAHRRRRPHIYLRTCTFTAFCSATSSMNMYMYMLHVRYRCGEKQSCM